MVRCNFNEVAITGVRKWKDGSGKRRQKSKKFYQTVNPYNKNEDGTPKSYEEILHELIAEREEWIQSEEIEG